MLVIIERIEDLFDESVVEEMLSYIDQERGVCHFNAAEIAREFSDWEVTYVEGYINGIGHAINSYTDGEGKKHYFDITQEKFKDDVVFIHEFDTVKEFTYEEVNQAFLSEGRTRLLAVETYVPRETL